MSAESEEKTIARIHECFSLFDRTRNSSCDERDVGTIIRSLGLNPSEKQVDGLVEQMRGDKEGSGGANSFISEDKFESVMLRVITTNEIPLDGDDTILRAFQALDSENKGLLQAAQLREYMTIKAKTPLSAEEFDSMLSTAQDKDSGHIFYEDYAELLARRPTR